jgi:23S rRNA (adenine2503-C2)-methyltransferase
MEKDGGERVSHLVVMGSGEPLDNYDNTLVFLQNIIAPYGLNIGGRHITLSTCGLVPQIKRLAAEKLSLTLAVSLHAPNNALRSSLLPVNKRYPLERLIEACREYIDLTGRRVTYEYALMDGVNDQPSLAIELSKLVSGMQGHVNLIAVNPVPELGVRPSGRERVAEFKAILEKRGVTVTLRRSLGADIAAACGQLRNRAVR